MLVGCTWLATVRMIYLEFALDPCGKQSKQVFDTPLSANVIVFRDPDWPRPMAGAFYLPSNSGSFAILAAPRPFGGGRARRFTVSTAKGEFSAVRLSSLSPGTSHSHIALKRPEASSG
jgi:hypothetical protein